MSFFDEADESAVAPRTQPQRRRPAGGRRGGGRRPPRDRQAIQTRRAVAAVVLLIIIVLIAVGVHSCEASARTSALRDYADRVSSLITQSDQTGTRLFAVLASGGGAANGPTMQNQINQARVDATAQLGQARGANVPGQLGHANGSLVMALRMRRDGIATIAAEIQPALGASQRTDAINAIAAQTARFYASDVLYKDYVAPAIAAALHGDGISIGTGNGPSISGGQFLPNVEWLLPSYIATQLGTTLASGSTGKVAPGLHGHSLNSVSVSGTTLQTGSTNTIPASPPPTFTLSFTNTGTNTETNVVCKVAVSGTSDSGQTIVPQTTAGQATTCSVKLNSTPPSGTQTVVATIEPVPGEKNTSNNTLSFPVTFQ